MDISSSVQQLSVFYLECIHEEGLRRLTFLERYRGRSFIGLPLDHEELLHQSAEVLSLPSITGGQRESFLDKAVADHGPDTGSGERLFYGFPVYVDGQGRIAPMFFLEVDITQKRRGPFRIEPVDAHQVLINHHLFRNEGYSPEEIATIQDELEGHWRSFPSQLAAALAHLRSSSVQNSSSARNSSSRRNNSPKRHPVSKGSQGGDWRTARPLPKRPEAGVHPSPILFRSAYSSYTYNLEKDLGALERYGFLQQGAKNTALAPYLSASGGKKGRGSTDPTEVLPLNDEQERAVREALSDPLSVITGPPGTGKSQVVVDLLAGAVLTGEPVLFASKNNKAVDVVRERLRALLGDDLDFTLRLGSKREMELTRDELGDRLDGLQERQSEFRKRFAPAKQKAIRQATRRTRDAIGALRTAHAAYEDAAAARTDVQETLPAGWADDDPPGSLEVLSQRRLQSVLDRARALAGERRLGFILWIKRLFMGGRLLGQLRDETESIAEPLPPNVREDIYRRLYQADEYQEVARTLEHLKTYRVWMQRLLDEEAKRHDFETLLNGCEGYEERFSQLKNELSESYRLLVRAVWGWRISQNLPEVQKRFRGYFNAVESLRSVGPSGYRSALDRLESALSRLAEYLPVWIVTNLSVRNALPLRPALFDLVIVDEASQCDAASAVPLLFRARRSVIIGDRKQLRHITSIRKEAEREIAQRAGAGRFLPKWSYVNRSLYDVAEHVMKERGGRPTLLRRHYRSHPAIIGFSNQQFYAGRLQPVRAADSFPAPEKWRGIRWHDIQGAVPEGIRSAYNQQEIEGVMDLLGQWHREGLLSSEQLSVGIVTPFRAQTDRLEEALRQQPWWGDEKQGNRATIDGSTITVGTAHRFQGDERDLMVFSPVVAAGMRDNTRDWVAQTDQLLNVAITRARASLQIVGDLDACKRAGGALEQLAMYATLHQESSLERPT